MLERTTRLWGSYEVLIDEPEYKVKRLTFNPNCSISKQYHKNRNELWVLIKGGGILEMSPSDNPSSTLLRMRPTSSIFIPKFYWHRFISDNCETVILETWFGSSNEKDIIRE